MWLKTCGIAVLLGTLLVQTGLADGKPLSEIVKAVEDQGYAPVEVELEEGSWEIEATKDGKTYELIIDPKSGEIRSVEEEGDDDDEEEAEEVQTEEVAEAPATPLRELEWLVGDWIDEGEDATIKTKCRWTRRRHFLTRTFSIESEGQVVLEGTQVIAWDPIYQQIRSWMYDSEGGFSEGTWSQDGDHWNVRAVHTLATGERASAINVLTYVDENTIRWKSINREIEGEIQPNIPEVTVVRRTDD